MRDLLRRDPSLRASVLTPALAPALVLVLALAPAALHAHAPEAGLVHEAAGWTVEPWVLACLALAALLYLRGLAALWRHAGIGRGIGRARAAAFAVAWLAIVAALVSPLDALGRHLFVGHMLQHALLTVVAAPLMVLARPLAAWTWALAPAARRHVGAAFHHPAWRVPWRVLTTPLMAFALHAIALWAWHAPAAFEAALRSDTVHTLQHLSFLLTALLFWWTLLRPGPRSAEGIAMLSLFATMLHSGALGALLALAPRAFYAPYLATAPAWGLDALTDQQLGGLVMWVPAGLAYLAVGLVLAARWGGLAGGPSSRSAAGAP